MLNQTAVCLESLITATAREGAALLFCHVITVISGTSETFTTGFAPIPEVTQVQLMVALETIFSAKYFVTSLEMVFSCVVIAHSKHLVFTFACSYFPTSSLSRLVQESSKKRFVVTVQSCEVYVFTRVRHSVHGEGAVLSQHALQVVSKHALQQGGLLQGVPALGGVWRPPPRKQTATVADGTHPTGIHCFFLIITI